MKSALLVCAAFLFCFPTAAADWNVGVSSVKITPEKPVTLAGYAARTNVFTSVELDLYAKGLAFQDQDGNRALLVTVEICTLSPTVSEPVREELARRTGLNREQILFSVSHTHSGPTVGLRPRSSATSDAVSRDVIEYTRRLQTNLVVVGITALSNLAPARVLHGAGIAHFVMNRREFTTTGVILGVNPRGFVDRSVPVLRIESPEGELRAVLFGYACHGTTLPSDSLAVSGDFPGYAREAFRKKHPNAEALFIAGLGGSANPYPRTGLNFAKEHGEELAREIERVLEAKLRPLNGPIKCVLEDAELPLQVPSREELQQALNNRRQSWMRGAAREMLGKLDAGELLPRFHNAPVAVWQFGSELTLVALSGEVVGEFVPLIERQVGPLNLWLAAYCNAVSGYIPTRTTLEQGGYECRGLYEGLGFYAPEAETVLLEKIAELTARAGRSSKQLEE